MSTMDECNGIDIMEIVAIIGLIFTIFSVFFPIRRYLKDKTVEYVSFRFNAYHDLIKKMVEPEEIMEDPVYNMKTGKRFESSSDEENHETLKNAHIIPGKVYGIMVDRQIAVIFELRNFPEYFEVTKRLASALGEQWKNEVRVSKEINFLLKYIDIYNGCCHKIFRFIGLSFISNLVINSKMEKSHL